MTRSAILSLTCPDRPGIVADVAAFLAERHCNILQAQQYEDGESGTFFMRVEFDMSDGEVDTLREAFGDTAARHAMDWKIRACDAKPNVLIMASKFDHCLVDLLYRWRIGELPMNIVAVVSNHEQAVDTALLGDVPFHHLPVTAETKPQQERRLLDLIEETGTDLVVLARYMQILSDDLSTQLRGRCINIHHSFLPGFKGAKPYHQAHARGVKMIGATSHYVTPDLDEGPIIAQDVQAISHRDGPDELVAKGRDIERRVLARAVKAHVQDKVFLNGARTVVFE